jgi:hypothetical protein
MATNEEWTTDGKFDLEKARSKFSAIMANADIVLFIRACLDEIERLNKE